MMSADGEEADGDAEAGARPASRPPGRRAGSSEVSGRDYLGCGAWAAGILVLVVASFAVGVILRPDGDSVSASTIYEGGSGESAYELTARLDETRAPCLTLKRDGKEVTGQCGFSPQGEGSSGRFEVTSSELPDGTTVVFAPVPPGTETVRIRLTDGSTEEIQTSRTEKDDIIWFVLETDAEVDGPADLLTAAGSPVPPPS